MSSSAGRCFIKRSRLPSVTEYEASCPGIPPPDWAVPMCPPPLFIASPGLHLARVGWWTPDAEYMVVFRPKAEGSLLSSSKIKLSVRVVIPQRCAFVSPAQSLGGRGTHRERFYNRIESGLREEQWSWGSWETWGSWGDGISESVANYFSFPSYLWFQLSFFIMPEYP